MAETSLFWDGTSTGDAGPYSSDEFNDWVRKFIAPSRANQGVIRGYANELAISNPAGTTIRVATGAAIVDGTFYENTADVDFSIVAPGAGTNWYTMVLRKSWSAQTVRLVLLGPAGAAPSPTQIDATTWELSIGEISITSAGAIDVAWYDTIGVNAGSAVGIVKRQGGDDVDWLAPGTTEYTTIGASLVCGSVEWTGIAAPNGTVTVNFPTAFLYTNGAQRLPLVFINAVNNSDVIATVLYPDANTNYGQVRIEWVSVTSTNHTSIIFSWMAIGEGTFVNFP